MADTSKDHEQVTAPETIWVDIENTRAGRTLVTEHRYEATPHCVEYRRRDLADVRAETERLTASNAALIRERSSMIHTHRDNINRLRADLDGWKQAARQVEAERDEALAREANANRMGASAYSSGFAAGVNAAVAAYEAAMGDDAHVYGIDRMLGVLAALTPAPQPAGGEP